MRQQRLLLLQVVPAAAIEETGAPVPPEVLEVRQALSKFTAAGSGVQFLHARVMVRGPGGAGKSATIEALAGKEFNASQMSTVGVGVDELELNHRELQLGRGDGVLKAYDRAAGEGEYVRAIAANAAAVLAGTATATGGSMLWPRLRCGRVSIQPSYGVMWLLRKKPARLQCLGCLQRWPKPRHQPPLHRHQPRLHRLCPPSRRLRLTLDP